MIPFNRPYATGREQDYLRQALASGKTGAGGPFTRACEDLIRDLAGTPGALLTNSCTAALELAALLIDLQAGDEVIMPAFTFPSTANAFLLRGAIPRFVDIRPDTLNLDEALVEAAITPRTRAIVAVHYAGVPCAMDALMAIAARHGLYVIEDAAQAFLSALRDRPAGSIGHLGAYSFHATKNISCGEGGALLVNDPGLLARAETLRDKGTNRGDFLRGRVRRYHWTGLGHSAAISDLAAAVLLAQLEAADAITAARRANWSAYDAALAPAARDGRIVTPTIPEGVVHNGHIYYVVLDSEAARDALQADLAADGIEASSHFEPLHLTATGRAYGQGQALGVSSSLPSRLLRLPLWPGLPGEVVDTVAGRIRQLPPMTSG